jgi:hypothetical protein
MKQYFRTVYLGDRENPSRYHIRQGDGWALVRTKGNRMARYQTNGGWAGYKLPAHIRQFVEATTHEVTA